MSADLQAAGEARRFARATLSGWEMAPLADDVAVIVSELLSNALRYGMTGPKDGAVPPRPVWLSLARRGRTLLCAVCDHSPDVPVIKEPDYFAQSGRGLHVIDSLSESWGWTPPNPAGKAVWAALST